MTQNAPVKAKVLAVPTKIGNMKDILLMEQPDVFKKRAVSAGFSETVQKNWHITMKFEKLRSNRFDIGMSFCPLLFFTEDWKFVGKIFSCLLRQPELFGNVLFFLALFAFVWQIYPPMNSNLSEPACFAAGMPKLSLWPRYHVDVDQIFFSTVFLYFLSVKTLLVAKQSFLC